MTDTAKAKNFDQLMNDAAAAVPLMILQAASAGGSGEGAEAQRLTQAACNAANALCALGHYLKGE